MSDLGFIDVSAAVLNQTFTFNLGTPLTNQATLTQMTNGQSDTVIINNLSGCTFRVMFQPSGRSFTLPAGVPTNPLPLSYKGTNDSQCQLRVDSLVTGNFPSQVHFDWFSASEPILYVAAAAATSAGAITLTAITAGSITIPSPDTWVISQDGSGNLNFTNTTTGQVYTIAPSASTATITFGASSIVDDTATNSTVVESKASGAALTGVAFQSWTGSATAIPLSLGGQFNSANTWFDQQGNLDLFNAVIRRIDGQLTAGNYGVPPIVAQSVNQNVTTTVQQNYLNYTPTSNGFYRISMGITLNNGTSGQNIVCRYGWYDPNTATSPGAFFSAVTGAVNVMSGSTSVVNGSYAMLPVTVYAGTGNTIVVHYQDPANTPNDFVTCTIERLT